MTALKKLLQHQLEGIQVSRSSQQQHLTEMKVPKLLNNQTLSKSKNKRKTRQNLRPTTNKTR